MEVKKKDNFLLYHNMYIMIKDLPDEMVGGVIKSIFRYSMDGELPLYENASIENLLFRHIQNSIDINAKKYYDKCEKNKENINKRWKETNKNIKNEVNNREEVVFINNQMLNEREYKSRFREFTYEFEDLLHMERELLKKDNIEKIKIQFNNKAISEETIRKYIKIQ